MYQFKYPQMKPRPKSWVKVDKTLLGNCKPNRMTKCFIGDKVHENVVYTHNNCVCNEYLALTQRHQVKTLDFTMNIKEMWKGFQKILDNTTCPAIDQLLTRRQVVNNYEGRWYRRYNQADLELSTRQVERRDFVCEIFCKDDKETVCVGEDLKAPRGIQYRRATGALEMGRFTHAVESSIYRMQDQFGTRIFGKGCNLHDLAEDLRKKVDNFRRPVFIMLDASKFDTHVSVQLLKLVVRFYLKIIKDTKVRGYVRWLWSHTYQNRGYSKRGISFSTNGTRMSGDMYTGLGNCLIMLACLYVWLDSIGIKKFSLTVNGDDSGVIIEEEDLNKARDISIFQKLGFKMKFDFTREFSQFEYCQCKPVETDYGWVMVRSPERILNRCGWYVGNRSASWMKHYVLSLGLGERAISYGVPIGYALAKQLLKSGAGGRELKLSRRSRVVLEKQKFWRAKEEATISLKTRLSYAEAWGISVDDQLSMESQLSVTLRATVTDRQWYQYLNLITQ